MTRRSRPGRRVRARCPACAPRTALVTVATVAADVAPVARAAMAVVLPRVLAVAAAPGPAMVAATAIQAAGGGRHSVVVFRPFGGSQRDGRDGRGQRQRSDDGGDTDAS